MPLAYHVALSMLFGSPQDELPESAHVKVFGRRHDEPFHALWRPASKKRQGTKSREVGHRRCCGAMEIFWHFSEVPVSVRDVCLSGQTGSNRRRLKTTRLTSTGHRVAQRFLILVPCFLSPLRKRTL